MTLCICDGPPHPYSPSWCGIGRDASYPHGPIARADITPELGAIISQAIRFPEPPREKAIFEPRQLRDENSYAVQVDVEHVVRDMIQRISSAEEGIREQVMVVWLREHGYTVTKEES